MSIALCNHNLPSRCCEICRGTPKQLQGRASPRTYENVIETAAKEAELWDSEPRRRRSIADTFRTLKEKK